MSQRSPEEFTQVFALPGLEITMVGQAPPDATGPLGRIANWLRPTQSEYIIGFYATTVAFDADGQQQAHDYFPSPRERSGMYETSRAIAEYCHGEPVAAAIYLDNSARPLRNGVREFEKLSYPDEPPTPAFFMNPRPFRQAADSENYQQFTDTLDASTELLSQRLHEVNSGLLAMKDEPIALVDACLHTGETLFYAKWALQEAGFNDVRTVVVSDDALPVRMLEPDMVTDDSIGYCRPFGYDFEVRAPKDDIFITPHQPATAKAISNAMRAEVRRIIREEHAARQPEQE